MKLEERHDEELILLVRERNSEALKELMKRYQGVAINVQKRFYLRSYDYQDWNQDSLLICYQSCKKYDFERGGKFGSFFKTNLVNHACSLLRHEMAKIREPYRKALSYELMVDDGIIQEEGSLLQLIPNSKILNEYVSSLSGLEVLALLHHLGKLDEDKLTEVTKSQLQQAKHRCKKKLERLLFNMED
ncbi:sigma-70 family RNA polymerase sigma factor [Lactobacillus sp. PV037]|uniref:sigma-70 family RNA polymerase sigma factor n=1 Tax=unclassified Lactobacillus TaxID=2620435 RepID=UPI002240143B|nr:MULTISPECIES: sigma-70 family RNA polymerase sigma factor [unclassified Lactobacillus]QNQ81863.1 sigma-70 family RNA polymerase sigma factor [Lactobacillus sp. PV012]QNQ84098.1 sigma-70 family RNA polymerase sigma factor [Lactobacillus sp. PV037]